MSAQRVAAADWLESVTAAKEEGYTFFDWLSAVDQTDADADPGFDVVLQLARPHPWQTVILTTRVGAGEPLASVTGLFVASVTGLFAGAAWHERETHEMFGVEFTGFDDGTGLGLRPLLLPEGFEGTPLRKDFVLAARASKAWPGTKEPGESDASLQRPTKRRRLVPPGVPDPTWGPR